jgi:hypothetical protein
VNQLTANGTLNASRNGMLARILTVASPEHPTLRLASANSPDRVALERRIAGKFAHQFGARVEQFLPYLVSLTVAGELGAVAGLRPARNTDLFLEQYLGSPVEQAISQALLTPVDRAQVVEIGNLASVAPGAASLLFGVLPTLLAEAGLRWVVCTATPQVRAMLDTLGFPTRTICAADPSVLGDKQRDWGSYYDNCPMVIVGDTHSAAATAECDDVLQELLPQLRAPIGQIATTLRAAG